MGQGCAAGSYREFLAGKSQYGKPSGFAPLWMPDCLKGFQASLDDWAIRQGRCALFAGTGLGKTLMQLVWAANVVRHANRPVLIMTPLAVGRQTVREAERFGIEAVRSADGTFPSGARIVVTNYEKLHKFDPGRFAGAVCDESSILKNFAGKRRTAITEFLRTLPYRLLCTATAAPNDYTELGTSSEAVGDLGHMDMLTKYFKNDQNTNQGQRLYLKESRWRFKGHAELPFWRWVCSWARACRKPSDLGFPDEDYALPPLIEREHVVASSQARAGGAQAEASLFDLEADAAAAIASAPDRSDGKGDRAYWDDQPEE